ncbi:MAG: VWA domain-containing protein [Candidatus Latescibacterota bacterium]|nr:VWA domain-containing protein [Candidatus Latescibacterota bacterium]
MRFADASLLWLLSLLPLLVASAMWTSRRRRRDLYRFASEGVAERLLRNVSVARQNWKKVLVVAGICLLAIALSGPQFGVKFDMAQRRGVDVVVCIDVSRSMLAEDLLPNRLERARHAIGRLLDALEGDRVGLVVFAANAYVQCPLTLDYSALRMLLSAVDARTIPSQGTSIANAVKTAASCFNEGDRQFKTIVLFSDGEAHDGDAVDAARQAAEEGAQLFVVGMGTEEGELIPIRSNGDRGGQVEYHKDRQGNYVRSRLDETGLRSIASAGEGAYFRASLSGGEIATIADRIAGLEEKDLGAERFVRYEERFQIPLVLSLICFFTEGYLSERVRRRGEWKGRFA